MEYYYTTIRFWTFNLRNQDEFIDLTPVLYKFHKIHFIFDENPSRLELFLRQVTTLVRSDSIDAPKIIPMLVDESTRSIPLVSFFKFQTQIE